MLSVPCSKQPCHFTVKTVPEWGYYLLCYERGKKNFKEVSYFDNINK